MVLWDPHAPYSEEVLSAIHWYAVKVKRQIRDGENLLAHRIAVLIIGAFVLVAFSLAKGRHGWCTERETAQRYGICSVTAALLAAAASAI